MTDLIRKCKMQIIMTRRDWQTPFNAEDLSFDFFKLLLAEIVGELLRLTINLLARSGSQFGFKQEVIKETPIGLLSQTQIARFTKAKKIIDAQLLRRISLDDRGNIKKLFSQDDSLRNLLRSSASHTDAFFVERKVPIVPDVAQQNV